METAELRAFHPRNPSTDDIAMHESAHGTELPVLKPSTGPDTDLECRWRASRRSGEPLANLGLGDRQYDAIGHQHEHVGWDCYRNGADSEGPLALAPAIWDRWS
jgi:hypothetical protein